MPGVRRCLTWFWTTSPSGPPSVEAHEIARFINATLVGRRIGTSAVTTCCLHAAATGLVQVTEEPMAFAYPTGPITTGEGRAEQS